MVSGDDDDVDHQIEVIIGEAHRSTFLFVSDVWMNFPEGLRLE